MRRVRIANDAQLGRIHYVIALNDVTDARQSHIARRASSLIRCAIFERQCRAALEFAPIE